MKYCKREKFEVRICTIVFAVIFGRAEGAFWKRRRRRRQRHCAAKWRKHGAQKERETLLVPSRWQWFPEPGSYYSFYGNVFLPLSLSLSLSLSLVGFSFCYTHTWTIYIQEKNLSLGKRHRNAGMTVSDTSLLFVSLRYAFFHRSGRTKTTF